MSECGGRFGIRKIAVFAPIFLITLACAVAGCTRTPATQVPVRLALARSPFTYLPVYLADSLGYYKRENLAVSFEEFPGGAKAVESVIAGSADAAAGFFEHAIQMTATGHPFVSFLIMLRYPGMALVVSPKSTKSVHGIADLKGLTVGVGTPGSPTHFYLNHLLAGQSMTPESVAVVGIGAPATAAAAVEQGRVDAAVVGAAMVVLRQHHPDLKVLAESFTAEGVEQSLGVEEYPGAALLARADWLAANSRVAHGLACAVLQSLDFIQTHTPEEILDRLPERYRTDRETDLATLRAFLPGYSKTGRMIPESAEAVRKMLTASLEDVRKANIDLAKTWTNDYARN